VFENLETKREVTRFCLMFKPILKKWRHLSFICKDQRPLVDVMVPIQIDCFKDPLDSIEQIVVCRVMLSVMNSFVWTNVVSWVDLHYKNFK